ncbi:Fe-S protein assembly co-chaperone HscB [Aphanomyces invadans]|uniref:Fe-S protein assembly co-chaperone HscB n=1 Tax=Aphanomyces invadans TaxID=157072 RepID=A0A024TKJ4_9STRA|nr:Fe-S protein assembly co-chaperone HscB [Aphanomyces invadans]ETV94558.1 Fe-S protein assembly co-chaperone HscB [Aphanomyces invadans]|eukprot:XP_008876873.1 Fe-S protein assembly co-chaperone HscB [Aphanomyces invadans]
MWRRVVVAAAPVRRWTGAGRRSYGSAQKASCGDADKTPDVCWKCGERTTCCSFFCSACNHIQPLRAEGACNYFKIFGIPESFAIDAKKVEQLYWSLQKKMHPDLYGSKSEMEKELSVVNSALVNQAYNLLKAPTSRANYLLRLHGIDALGDATTYVEPAVLMEIMEAREDIEECDSMEHLEQLKAANASQIEACMHKLTQALDSNQDFAMSKQLTVELQYLVKLSEAILDKQDHLDK